MQFVVAKGAARRRFRLRGPPRCLYTDIAPFALRRIGVFMKCDLCTTDDGNGIHYHAFVEGKHHWVCEECKKKLKVESEHMDD